MNKRIFAIGDIHGCFDSFKQLVERKIEIKKSDKLVLLGDYIDRGSQSKEVIDYIIEMQQNDFDVIPLMGNHEAMLLNAIKDDAFIPVWIYNGGSETLKSFNIQSLKEIDQIYIEFFKSLQYYYSFNDLLFVHAGFNDEVSNPFEDNYSMIWECRKEYNNPSLKNKTIIHGHCLVKLNTCQEAVSSNKKVINIDTGCVYADKTDYGILTALEVNARTIYFV